MTEVFLTNKNLKDINPLSCGMQICKPGHKFGPAQREYYLLHYILSGEGIYQNDDRYYPVKSGQIFIIRPFETTIYQADTKTPWHYCWIGFECHIDPGNWIHANVIEAASCAHIFRDLCDNVNAMAEKEYYLCGRIYELISILSEPFGSKNLKRLDHILQAKNYIEANYVYDISIEKIAASLNLNRCYFSTAFRKYLGKSPQQYLVDFRLKKAAELLSVRHFSPSEAAANCGYKDLFNFSKMFKKRYGVSPGQYGRSD